MALTLNQFTGFETAGNEEAQGTGGSPDPTETTIVRTGGRSLAMPSDATTRWNIELFDIIASAGNSHVFGFAFYSTDITPSAITTLIDVRSTGGINSHISIRLTSAGRLEVWIADFVGTAISASASTAIAANEWNYIELWFENLDSGDCELFINGVSVGTATGQDFLFTNTMNLFAFQSRAVMDATVYYDDFYWLSGATASSDAYGNWAVKTNQSTDVGDTDQGDALADGTWALVSETPGNSGTSNDASYVDTGNLTGPTITDGGDRAGPSGDGDITGATIKGAKYIANLKRTTGGGRVHTILHGNNVDGVTATADLGLTVDYIIYEVLSEAAGIVPTVSEFFQQGFSKSATAGQDILCGDQWAMLGYVPGVGAAPVINLVMAPYIPA